MKYLQLILISIIIINCRPIRKVKNPEYCATKFYFGEVDNMIPLLELDSIIFSKKLTYFSDYKPCNAIEREALKLIKDTAEIIGFKTNEYVIKKVDLNNRSYHWILSQEIYNNQDTIVAFTLRHIDGIVYYHNLNKLNSEYKKNPDSNGWYKAVVGTAGNFSGHDGIYLYTQNLNKIMIYKHQ